MITLTKSADMPIRFVALHSAYCRVGALLAKARTDGDWHGLMSRHAGTNVMAL